MQRPIIVVTGANAGVGYGICQRLLFQLSEPNPPDTQLVLNGLSTTHSTNGLQSERYADQFLLPCEGITLIMACRSVKRAEAARVKLLKSFNAHVEKLKRKKGYMGHAETFRENLRVEIHSVDLAMISTIRVFAEEIKERYPYISHLIFNAGVAPFCGIDWLKCLKQFIIEPLGFITTPNFYMQTYGERSLDGYGWVWQCNVFGHYYLYKKLYPMLASKRYPFDARVIWTSSLEAKRSYEEADWQLKETRDPYGSSKYQTELISAHLDRISLKTTLETEKRIRHLITHPGVCSTDISKSLIVPILQYAKVMAFYLGRFFGSPNHTISWENGAVSVVWVSIISLATLSGLVVSSSEKKTATKFAAQTDWWGNARVGVAEVRDWDENRLEAEKLVERCEGFYREIEEERRRPIESETATEWM